MTWLRGNWQLLLLGALVVALWETPIVWPLKILVVFFHELAHGLAAILTGGALISISLSVDEGGVATTQGGSRFLILSAGYLGSLVCGVCILLAGLRSSADRAVMAGLGVVMLVITGLYIRDQFAVLFCLATGAGMLAIARWLPHQVNDLGLRLIGLTSIVYVPRDIISDTITRRHLQSDAYMLGEQFFGSAVFWGVIWLAISAVVIWLCLSRGLGAHSNIAFRGKGRT